MQTISGINMKHAIAVQAKAANTDDQIVESIAIVWKIDKKKSINTLLLPDPQMVNGRSKHKSGNPDMI